MKLPILGVYDEGSVLEPLRRTFHRVKSEWSVEFVLSGAASLNSLTKSPADVMVLHARHGRLAITGSGKRTLSTTARLVLSGHTQVPS